MNRRVTVQGPRRPRFRDQQGSLALGEPDRRWGLRPGDNKLVHPWSDPSQEELGLPLLPPRPLHLTSIHLLLHNKGDVSSLLARFLVHALEPTGHWP